MTQDPNALLKRANLTRAQACVLLGVDERTMRRWCSPTGRWPMPEAARRLLMLIADVPAVVRYLENIIEESQKGVD